MNTILLYIYIAYLVLMSLLAVLTFKLDKSKAINKKERIKEKTLLEITCFGGAIGSFISRIIFRHKTKKIYFSIVIYLSLILQLGVLILLIIGGLK